MEHILSAFQTNDKRKPAQRKKLFHANAFPISSTLPKQKRNASPKSMLLYAKSSNIDSAQFDRHRNLLGLRHRKHFHTWRLCKDDNLH
jgi:hypothetical protein